MFFKRKSPQRSRRQYRIPVGLDQSVRGHIQTPEGSFLVALIDTTVRGICFSLPPDSKLRLEVGQRFTLSFEFPDLEQILTAEAVVLRVPSPEYGGYGAEFQNGRLLSAMLTPRQWRVFNSRQVERICVADEGCRALVEVDGDRFGCQLLDLSTAGLAFRAGVGCEVLAEVGSTLVIDADLPDGVGAVRVAARVSNVTRVGEDLRVGVQIDAEQTEDFAAQQELLTGFVMARYRAAEAADDAA